MSDSQLNEENERDERSVNPVVEYFSTYIYYFVITIAFIVMVVIRRTQKSPLVSTKAVDFDKSSNPIMMLHGSDLHVAPYMAECNASVEKFVKIAKKVNPDQIVFSGDLVENYDHHGRPGPTHNNEEHWKTYKTLRDSAGFESNRFFEVLGNHDVWEILSPNSSKNLPDKYTLTKSFLYTKTKEVGGVRLIGFLPYETPIAVGISEFWKSLSQKAMDELEKAIKQETSAKTTFLVTHFPTLYLFPKAKTSSGKSYTSLLRENNINVILNGHTHPEHLETYHEYSDLIEATASTLGHYGRSNAVIIDNGRVSFHEIEDEIDELLAYPVPAEQLTFVDTFNEIEIRLLVFTNDQSLEIPFESTVNGTLVFNRQIKNGVQLYTSTVKLDNGVHTLKIHDKEITFSVNTAVKGYKEKQTFIVRPLLIVISFSIYAFYDLVIIISMWMPCSLKSEKAILKFLLSPFLVGKRIGELGVLTKILFSILYIWGVCLPQLFFKSDGSLGVSFMFGYVLNGEYKLDAIQFVFAVAYLGMILPFVLHIISVLNSDSLCLKISSIITSTIFLVFGLFLGFKFGLEEAYNGMILTSATFVWFPLLFILYIIAKFIMSRKKDESNDSSNLVLENL